MVKRHSTAAALRAPSGTQAVERAFAILQAFSDLRRVWTLADLSRSLGLAKPTALRLLGVLEREGMVERTVPGGGYRLGPGAMELGARAQRSHGLTEAVLPLLDQLAHSTGETASLEVLVGDQILVLAGIQGRHRVSVAPDVGTRWPAHAASTGKVILAGLREREGDLWRRQFAGRARLLELTPRTITSLKRLDEELARVTRRGYATAIEELEPNFVAMGAPVRDIRGEVVAGLSLAGPASRLSAERVKQLVGPLMKAAEEASRRLGWAGSAVGRSAFELSSTRTR
ncbi:MAG TPA: IclR family transcriptional regulator [Gemmatimonadales bacterium]|nr:IclR family transcriptional regulator [Gemmatimonadales bacterium]